MARRSDARLLAVLSLALFGCSDPECTEAGCESKLSVSYGLSVSEPYSLTINPEGPNQSFTCLSNDPDAEPLPEWLTCDAGGFEITGERAETTTISVSVVRLSTQEAVIPSALVTLAVDETLEPNGPDCPPACYERSGSVVGN